MKVEVIKRPLEPTEVEWRVQSSKNGWITVVPYIQNRAVMERLDEACEPTGWKNEYREWKNKGVLCGISIKVESEWVTKWDGADDTDIEPTKGGLSDSMKRAAVQWGMGRQLYKYPRIQIEGEGKYIPFWATPRLQALVKAFNEGKLDKEFYQIKNQ